MRRKDAPRHSSSASLDTPPEEGGYSGRTGGSPPCCNVSVVHALGFISFSLQRRARTCFIETTLTIVVDLGRRGLLAVAAGLLAVAPMPSSAQCIPLTCDQADEGRIDDPAETDCYGFAVAEGEIVSVSLQEIDSEGDFTVEWRLVDRDGAAAGGLCGSVELSLTDVLCDPLPASGNPHRLEVYDRERAATGGYRVRIQRLSVGAVCEDVPIACDESRTGTAAPLLDTDLFSFDVGDGERVSVAVIADEGAPVDFLAGWRLVDRDGNVPDANCAEYGQRFFPAICGPLNAAGNPYRLEVGEAGHLTTGSYHLGLQRLRATTACDQTAIACGAEVTGRLDVADSDLFSFDVPDGEVIAVTVVAGDPPDGTARDPSWQLVDKDGRQVPGLCGVFHSRPVEMRCDPLPAEGNPYRLQVGAALLQGTGSYRARVDFVTSGCAPAPACIGDCDVGGAVTVDELITGVTIALGEADVDACLAFDADGNEAVTVDELVAGVDNALDGCPAAAAE
jgi:hypothetical protein